MTNYSSRDLEEGWEFKIVRANTGIFRKPAELEKLVKEEAPAGWILLEKFDNSRVRFKRPISARSNDYRLPAGVDPYRTHYGMNPAVFVAIIVGFALFLTFTFMGLIFLVIGVGASLAR